MTKSKAGVRVGAVLVAGLLAWSVSGCVIEPATVITVPAIFPNFSRDITDYVNRCNPSTPTSVQVTTDDATTVSVDGGPSRTGQFQVSVPQQVGRRFVIAVTKDGITTTHSVRCLPPDFPDFEVTRYQATQAQYYVTLPFSFSSPSGYPTIFDDHGVPIWWAPQTNGYYAALLPDGNPMWIHDGVFEEHSLNGALVRTYSTVGQPLDGHELVVLPNGNHLVASLTPRPHTDLSSWGGPSDVTITDHVVQEVDPSGQVVWSWDTADHIPVSETAPYWQQSELATPGGGFGNNYDPYHINSIEPDGDGLVLSFRHLDAVFKINGSTGAIEWKLGGTLRPESLAFVNDPVAAQGGAFAGQHDARILSDGTLTLFDDGTDRARPPRGVAYRLDLNRRRATLVQQVADPDVFATICCGSARVLAPRGNYVFGWGGNPDSSPDITEMTPSGQRTISIRFPDDAVYRALPVPFNAISPESLRQGMDAQYGVQP